MLYEQIQEAVKFIRSKTPFNPRFGIILGTGLSGLADEIKTELIISYKDMPHFPEPTVESHQGKLIFGYLSDQPVVVMAGRFHYYEGYSMKQVTFPVRVLKFLGIERLIISNVAGSTNANIYAGDLVFIKDHINFQPENPLRGINDERLGPRFPDMLHTYDKGMISLAEQIAQKNGIRAHKGVYFCLQGPNLETPAEYTFIHRVGADVVGMSTVPEVIVARHMSLPVFVISVVSNKCYPPESITETTIESVIALAKKAEVKMRLVVLGMLREVGNA